MMDDSFQFGPTKGQPKSRFRGKKQRAVQAEVQQAEVQQAEAFEPPPERGTLERSSDVKCPDPTCRWPNSGDATSCIRCRKPLARPEQMEPGERRPLETLSPLPLRTE